MLIKERREMTNETEQRDSNSDVRSDHDTKLSSIRLSRSGNGQYVDSSGYCDYRGNQLVFEHVLEAGQSLSEQIVREKGSDEGSWQRGIGSKGHFVTPPVRYSARMAKSTVASF